MTVGQRLKPYRFDAERLGRTLLFDASASARSLSATTAIVARSHHSILGLVVGPRLVEA
jgi:hypothetical protein